LEIGELRDFHPVHHDLPAHARRSQRRRFPVVLLESDVVLQRIDAEGAKRVEVDPLDVERRRLEDDLELVVLVHPHRVLAVAAVAGAPRRLTVGDVPRLRAQHAEEGVRVHRPRADLDVVGLLKDAAPLAPEALDPQEESLKVHRRGPDAAVAAVKCR
jgi:hypothetical protein